MVRLNREAEIRSQEMLDDEFVDFSNPLAVPAGVAQEGYRLKWVNTSIKDKPTRRVEDHERTGYSLVPFSRNSSKSYDSLGRNPLSKDFNTYKDVILMEVPERKAQRIINHYNNQSTETHRAALRATEKPNWRT